MLDLARVCGCGSVGFDALACCAWDLVLWWLDFGGFLGLRTLV